MVYNPTPFFELSRRVVIPVAAELLAEYLFDIFYHRRIFKDLALGRDTEAAGCFSFPATSLLVIMTAHCDS